MQRKNKMTAGARRGCIAFAILGFLLLAFFAPLAWQLHKNYEDAETIKAEFIRTVDPTDLRAWVMEQAAKHPPHEYIGVAKEAWPSSFPKRRQERFRMSYRKLDGDGSQSGAVEAYLIWDFGSDGLKVTVSLHPDGAPVELEHGSSWAKGVRFEHIPK
jgi:hypothetical protein